MVLNSEPSRPNQTKPSWLTYPTYFPDPPELHHHLTYPPVWPTHLFILPTYLIYPLTQISSQNWQITSLSPQITSLNTPITCHCTDSTTWPNFIILTKFHNLDQIPQIWLNFTISTKFHNLNGFSEFWKNFMAKNHNNLHQISHFWPNVTIFTKNLNLDQKSQFWPKIIILTKNRNFNLKITNLTKSHNFDRTKHNFDQKSQFWPNFTLLAKCQLQDNIGQWRQLEQYRQVGQILYHLDLFYKKAFLLI